MVDGINGQTARDCRWSSQARPKVFPPLFSFPQDTGDLSDLRHFHFPTSNCEQQQLSFQHRHRRLRVVCPSRSTPRQAVPTSYHPLIKKPQQPQHQQQQPAATSYRWTTNKSQTQQSAQWWHGATWYGSSSPSHYSVSSSSPCPCHRRLKSLAPTSSEGSSSREWRWVHCTFDWCSCLLGRVCLYLGWRVGRLGGGLVRCMFRVVGESQSCCCCCCCAAVVVVLPLLMFFPLCDFRIHVNYCPLNNISTK